MQNDVASGYARRTNKQRKQLAASYSREAQKVQATDATLTTSLYNGETVLAKAALGHIFPKTFANRTQAQRAADAAGGYVVQRGRPFYMVMP